MRLSCTQTFQLSLRKQAGWSVFVIVILISIVGTLVYTTAKTVKVNERVSANLDTYNATHQETRGNNFLFSSTKKLTLDDLTEAMDNITFEMDNTNEVEASITYLGKMQQVKGFSLDRFDGYQFEIESTATKTDTQSYSRQHIGITYISGNE